MNKIMASLATAGIISSTTIFATTPTFAMDEHAITLNLNGVNVEAKAHMMDSNHVFASVNTFASYYGVKFSWNEASKALTINGNVVSNVYGTPEVFDGALTASIRAMAESLGGDHYAIGWDNQEQQANVSILPEGVKQLSPVVPQMGEHWADPKKNWPLGPIYGIYKGKLVFLEYMPAKDLDKTVPDIPGNTVPIPPNINHTDIDWNPNGHEGYPVPHYDVHLYFISRDEQNKIVPDVMQAPPSMPMKMPMSH